jgi:hypothetical protein
MNLAAGHLECIVKEHRHGSQARYFVCTRKKKIIIPKECHVGASQLFVAKEKRK